MYSSLFQGFWSRFFPIYEDLRKLLASGSVGEPQFVSANLGAAVMELESIASRLLDDKVAGVLELVIKLTLNLSTCISYTRWHSQPF